MTNSISLIAPAKLNLNLFVKEKLDNGYHSLESDICFLDLHDEIKIELSDCNRIKLSNKSTFFLKDKQRHYIISIVSSRTTVNSILL